MGSIVGAGLLLTASSGSAGAEAKGTAAAQVEKPPGAAEAKSTQAPPTKEALRQYRKELAQGREADGQGRLEEARKHFEAAVALLPGGSAALSEMGWVAYRLKDLKAAEPATRAAVRFSVQPSVRAGSLYNLGRILTDQGKKAEAVQAYRESWELVRNPVTLAALKALDPAAAAATWPRTTPLTGPAVLADATPAALKQAACRAQLEWVAKRQTNTDSPLTLDRLNKQDVGHIECKMQDVRLPSGGALKRVVVVSADFNIDHYGLSTVGLWARTGEGWFMDFAEEAESWKWEGVSVTVNSVQAAGSLVEVRLSSHHWSQTASAHYIKGGQEQGDPPPQNPQESESFLYVLGVGPSGRPSVTSRIHFSTARSVEDDEGKTVRSADKTFSVKLQPSGELQIGTPIIRRNKMTDKESSVGDLQTPTGTFKLAFP